MRKAAHSRMMFTFTMVPTHQRTTSLIYGAAGGLILGLIAFLGFLLLVDDRSESAPEFPSKSGSSNSHSTSSNVNSATVRSSTDLAQLMAGKSSSGRALVLGTLLRHANEERLADLFRMAGGVEDGQLRFEAQLMILQTLAFENPRSAMRLAENRKESRRGAMIEAVFSEWANKDLNDATAYAASLVKSDKRAAISGILLGATDLEEAELLEIGRKLGDKQLVLDSLAQNLVRLPVEDHRTALSLYLSRHGSRVERATDIERRLLNHIVKAFLREGGLDAIREVTNSLFSDQGRATMLGDLLISLDRGDSHTAFAVAVAMRDHDPDILARALARWSQYAPVAALSMATRLDEEGDKSRMQRASLAAWAESDPSNLLDSLSVVPERLRIWSQRLAMFELAYIEPDAAAKRLGDMPEGYDKENVIGALVLQWAENDPHIALDWAQQMKLEDPDSPRDLIGAVLAGVSRSDPQLALNMALSLPSDENGIGQEVFVIGQVAGYDTELAVELASQARDDKTRHRALFWIGSVLGRQDSYEEAADLMQGTSEDAQVRFLRWISVDWCREYPQRAYEYFDDLPVGETQALYAQLLLTQHSQKAFLNTESVHRLEHIVSETSPDHPAHSHPH